MSGTKKIFSVRRTAGGAENYAHCLVEQRVYGRLWGIGKSVRNGAYHLVYLPGLRKVAELPSRKACETFIRKIEAAALLTKEETK